MDIVKSFTNYSEQSHVIDCTNCTNGTRVLWEYYVDENGTMIAYPYNRGDPMYEDDQCTNYKILYDPRIKPVSK